LLERSEPKRRLACLVLDDTRSVALGSEPIRVDGEIAGRVTSGGYGYTIDRSIAHGYVPAEVAPGLPVEIEIFGKWVGGEVADKPLFDPEGERIRG
jgi:glycine cleavage system aminomethyltransferase T